jgi:hypothetical protein
MTVAGVGTPTPVSPPTHREGTTGVGVPTPTTLPRSFEVALLAQGSVR